MYGSMQPDWVIFGIQTRNMGTNSPWPWVGEPDSVTLLASRILRKVDVQMVLEDDDWPMYYGPRSSEIRDRSPRVELKCVMADFVMVEAKDYTTAFANLQDLFRQWDEKYGPMVRLPAQPALPEPPPEALSPPNPHWRPDH